jgi:hypothetical protein
MSRVYSHFFAPPRFSPSLVTEAADDEGRFSVFQFVLMHAKILQNQAHVILNATRNDGVQDKRNKKYCISLSNIRLCKIDKSFDLKHFALPAFYMFSVM